MGMRTEPVSLFLSYAPEDEQLRDQLAKHLSLLQRQGFIATWHDQQIMAGAQRSQEIDAHLTEASIILLLISPDFLASDYCYSVEMQQALARQQAGLARVIPVILRPVDWQSALPAHLPCLPTDGRPVTSWPNQDEAFQAIVQEIRALIDPFNRIDRMYRHTETAPSTLSPRELRYRQKLQNKVYTSWIVGVLQGWLEESPFIPLKLEERPDALDNPLQSITRETARPARSLPLGTSITSIYDAANGELLILGEPGSGKTTLLLELTRELLERSRRDSAHPIPIVLNLSEWARKQQPFADWIREELRTKYNVARKMGKAWIEQDQLILLLDGLDEVPQKLRGPCIDAINAYQTLHDLASLIVCCRQNEYQQLALQQQKLRFQYAVTVQPLTIEQIDTYLQATSTPQEALKEAIHSDTTLQQLAKTPLMLTILARTYQAHFLRDALLPNRLKALQTHLFEAYVQRMLQPRGRNTRYTEQQTRAYLAFLAAQMNANHQTEFYIEQMQPDWLDAVGRYSVYRFIANHLIDVLAFFCSSLLFTLVGVILVRLIFSEDTTTPLGVFLFQMLPFGAVFTLGIVIFFGIMALIICLFTRTIPDFWNAVVTWWQGLLALERIELVETIIWPWKRFKLSLIPPVVSFCFSFVLIMGGIFGFLAGASLGPNTLFSQQCTNAHGEVNYPSDPSNPSGISSIPDCDPPANADARTVTRIQSIQREIFDAPAMFTGIISGFVTALVLEPLLGLGIFLFTLVSWKVRERSSTVKANHGFWLTAFNSVLLGFLGWLAFALIYGLCGGLIVGHFFGSGIVLPFAITVASLGATVFALAVWFRFGGLACIQYSLLRLLLPGTRRVPWRYGSFLDYASERQLLHKVGGGYIFFHQLLQDYFAALQQESYESSRIFF